MIKEEPNYTKQNVKIQKSSKAKQVKKKQNKTTHRLNVLAVCGIDCKSWILIFIKVYILIFKVLLWLLKMKHNYVYSTKKHNQQTVSSVMMNMRSQVFFFFFFFFITFHKSKNRKVTIFTSTGMQNSTIIKEMRYVSIVYDLLFTFLFFL